MRKFEYSDSEVSTEADSVFSRCKCYWNIKSKRNRKIRPLLFVIKEVLYKGYREKLMGEGLGNED